MKVKAAAAVALMALATAPTHAAATYPSVQTWDPGCEHTMETSHFELAAGQSVEIQVDLSGCTAEQAGTLLFYGYVPRTSGSDGLSRRHNVRLQVVNEAMGSATASDDGHVLVFIGSPTRCTLVAQNLSARKAITLRLVARAGL
jgi:hypothetical protein